MIILEGNSTAEKVVGVEVGSVEVRNWARVNFQSFFNEIPIVVVMPTNRGGDPATIRIKNVTRTGFEAVVVEPRGEDGPHLSMLSQYLAVVPGTQKLGSLTIQGGKIRTKKSQFGRGCAKSPKGFHASWADIRFHKNFKEAPALLTQIQTVNSETNKIPTTFSKPFLTVATEKVTKHGAKVALELSEAMAQGDKMPKDEDIGYIALTDGKHKILTSTSEPVEVLVQLTDRIVDGWDDDGTLVNFCPSGMVLAVGSKVTRNGADGGWLRMDTQPGGVTVRIDEDRNCDKERRHTKEEVDVVAFPDEMSLGQNSRPVKHARGKAALQARTVKVSGSGWKHIKFKHAFRRVPVVVLTPSSRGPHPATIRVKRVTRTGFMAAIAEPRGEDGPHFDMEVAYLAVQPGKFHFKHGRLNMKVEAGRKTTDKVQAKAGKCKAEDLNIGWDRLKFKQSFRKTPAFLTGLQTANSEEGDLGKKPSTPFLTVAVQKVTRRGADISVELSETSKDPKQTEDKVFQKLQGACRTAKGTHGKYTTRKHYDQLCDCAKACHDQEDCVAYEWNGDAKSCELHTQEITKIQFFKGKDLVCGMEVNMPVEEEVVGYIAVQEGRHNFGNNVGMGAAVTKLSAKGWDDGATGHLTAKCHEFDAVPMVFGSKSSRQGPNGGWLRLHGQERGSATFSVDEDQYCDKERNHVKERLSFAAFSHPFNLQIYETPDMIAKRR